MNPAETTHTVIDGKMVIEWPDGLKGEYTLRMLDDMIAEYTQELAKFEDYRRCILAASGEQKAARPVGELVEPEPSRRGASMSNKTLQLLMEMVWKYEPHYPDSDVECGYCKKKFDNSDFHNPENHPKSCTFAAAVRHLAAIDASEQQEVGGG